MTTGDFDRYGATRRTLRAFIASYEGLVRTVRDVLVPDPDARPT